MGAPQYTTAFGTALLQGIGAPVTAANLRRLSAWAQEEGTSATNNPFATTENEPGSSDFNSVGVKNYPSAAAGVAATIATLENGDYASVVTALQNPNTTDSQFTQALGASPWSGSGAAYGNAIAQILNIGPSPAAAGAPVTIGTNAYTLAPSSSTSSASSCRFAFKAGPLGSVCMDKTVGVLAIVGGGLVVLAGIAAVAAYAFQSTGAQKALGGAAKMVPGPVGVAAKGLAGQSRAKPKARPKAKPAAKAIGEPARQPRGRVVDRDTFEKIQLQRSDAARRRQSRADAITKIKADRADVKAATAASPGRRADNKRRLPGADYPARGRERAHFGF